MLENKVAVVTGGSRGIGRAVARKFAENHADVAIVSTAENETARNTISELCALGVKAKLFVCDIKNPEEVQNISEEILKEFGGVDILVNNAGITRDNLLPMLSVEDIDDVIDVNLKGAIFVTRAFLRNFIRKKSGNIINISSVVGLMGNKGQANYAASKAGIIGLTKSLAKEYGNRNIRVNAIAPGYISTDMTDKLSAEAMHEIQNSVPLKRLGKPEDIAELALFLASDRSVYITGDVIRVDGGMYI